MSNQKLFRAEEVSWNLGTSINISRKTQEKRSHKEIFWSFFIEDTHKLIFWMENSIQRLEHFIVQIQESFIWFSKKGRGGLSPTTLVPPPVWVAKHESISLNIPKCTRKRLNKLFWLCHGSEYSWSSYIFDRILKMPRVLNVPGFWNGTVVYTRLSQSSENVSCSDYARVLNMLHHLKYLTGFWICINPEIYQNSEYAVI